MKKYDFWKLSKRQLWNVRKQVVLNSYFLSDYKNSYGFDNVFLCNFFDGYVDYLFELASEKHENPGFAEAFALDNAENLYSWRLCADC